MWALEALEELSKRHATRALWIDGGEPAPWRTTRLPAGVDGGPVRVAGRADGYWQTKALRARAIGEAVREEVARARPDVLLTQLHAAPAAIEAAGVPAVVLLPSYEALCKHAFHADSDCSPARDCTSCPAAHRLPRGERVAMLASRAAHAEALASAARLVAVGPAVARACEEWTGREAAVISPVASAPPIPSRPPGAGGHVLLAAAGWTTQKGADLVVPLAEALAPREVVITPRGLGDRRAQLAVMPSVRLPGSPVAELLAGAAVLLVPSRWQEPFGRVAFEALAAGVPVAASAVGSLPSFVPAEGLIEPGAPVSEWADRVALLTEPVGFAAVSDRAREAAAGVLRQRPLASLEQMLLDAAGATSRPPRQASARSQR
jgi:glycosyltransferase involved in cell wall biosynthesis